MLPLSVYKPSRFTVSRLPLPALEGGGYETSDSINKNTTVFLISNFHAAYKKKKFLSSKSLIYVSLMETAGCPLGC